MVHGLLLAWGLLSSPARASDSEGLAPLLPPGDGPDVSELTAATDVVEAGKNAVETKASEAELKRQERLQALDAARSAKVSRVVVLKWPNERGVDYKHEVLQNIVKTRIARPDSKFYPEIDLYQAGRKEPDKTVRPIDQRAMVPSGAVGEIMAAVDAIAPVPWNQLTESEWGLKANELRDLSNKIWFIDRPELREPVFQLYVQIGRAAENQNNPVPPFYQPVGELPVNWYWYLAGAMGHVEPELMAKLTDQDLYASVNYYKELLDSGKIDQQTLSFEDDGEWDPKAFAAEYQVFINGIEVLIDDKDSLFKVPPGRVDVYLKREDGHSLSDAIDITKLEEKIYFVREVARKRMGIDFIDQLMEHPNECSPELDGDILNYLAIYAKLHPEAEIYIAVPEGGNPNRVLIWRWDRPSATLQKVLDPGGGFPVRFAFLLDAGAAFNGMNVNTSPPTVDPDDPTADPLPSATPEFAVAGIPVDFQLRGHYGRFIGIFGLTYALSGTGGPWQDSYQVDGGTVVEDPSPPAGGDLTVKLKERDWSRTIYGGFGFMFMKDAAVGLGPRLYVKGGHTNVPHNWEVTLHGGLTTATPFSKRATGRVRTIVDIDGFGGMLIPQQYTTRGKKVGATFGLQAGIGLTF